MTTAYEWTFCLTMAWTGIIAGLIISYVIVICVPLFLTIHFGSPFGQAEKQVNSGQVEAATAVRNYLKFNIPLHLLYAIIFQPRLSFY